MPRDSSTSPPQPTAPRALRIGLLAVALLLGWRGVLALTGWHAEFAECSYQQNLLRLESYRGRVSATPGIAPPRVIAGTSVTGRLLPEYFAGTPLNGLANLGLDGATPTFALEALLRESAVPRLVLLETFLLHESAKSNENLINTSLASPGARLADADLLFGTETRPSTLLYSALKRGRESHAPGHLAPSHPVPYEPHFATRSTLTRLTNAITALRARGSEVVLVDIPIGADWPPGPNLGEPTASQVAGLFGLRRLDCRAALRARGFEPRFTDGLHLDAGSAREVARALGELVAALPAVELPP